MNEMSACRKESMISALTLEQTNYPVPIWELEFHLWDIYSDRKFLIGNEFARLSRKEKDIALYTNAEIIAEVSDLLHFAAVSLPADYWELAPGHPSYYWLPDDYILKQAKAVYDVNNDKLLLVAQSSGVLSIPSADEYVDFSMQMFQDPETIDKRAKLQFDESITQIDAFMDIGINTFFTASDVADNSGPFFPPLEFERFILNYLNRWSGYIKNNNGLSILHSDGNIEPYMDQLLSTEINAIQAIDPVAKMDIFAIKKKYGSKICLCGNIDCGLMFTGPREDIYSNTKNLIEKIGGKGGFVLGASNAIEITTPITNYNAMINAWEECVKQDIPLR